MTLKDTTSPFLYLPSLPPSCLMNYAQLNFPILFIKPFKCQVQAHPQTHSNYLLQPSYLEVFLNHLNLTSFPSLQHAKSITYCFFLFSLMYYKILYGKECSIGLKPGQTSSFKYVFNLVSTDEKYCGSSGAHKIRWTSPALVQAQEKG